MSKSMRVIDGRPPNFDAILKAFPLAGNRGVCIAYGWDLFVIGSHGNPKAVSPEILLAHEPVHALQHEAYPGGVELWWDRYMIDADFRFSQELPAHIAEYRYLIDLAHSRKRTLREIAAKLAAPLYGNMRSAQECERLIHEGAHG